MKERIEKIIEKEVNIKILTGCVVLMLVLLLVPIARIMMNCVPWYDDFGYGKMTKDFWELRNSFWDAVMGAFTHTRQMWYAWQGTYTSCFFMSMMPAVWGTDKYVLGLWFVLGVLVLGIFCLVHVLLKEVLKSEDKWRNLLI